jgi:nifR3 family TIM-barrel protein
VAPSSHETMNLLTPREYTGFSFYLIYIKLNEMKNFWRDLKTNKEHIFCLAPMADVTDAAFRSVIAKYGKPDVMWTEFVSADGLVLAPEEGKKKLLEAFIYSSIERPIVAQIFGANPENIARAAKIVEDLGFDGVDINMGCPDRSVQKQKAGAALMKNPELAIEIIQSTKKAVNIPVSVKIRIGYNKDELETWLPKLISAEPEVISIHARTKKEMSKVPANWDRIKRAVEIRDEIGSSTLIIGNGDVSSLEEGRGRIKETGCDGVMIGRGIFGKPWFFSGNEPDLKTKLNILEEHILLFEKLLPNRNFNLMKKHFKAYIEGFNGAKELRLRLMDCINGEEVISILKTWGKENI